MNDPQLASVVEHTEHPEVIRWRGLRFKREPPSGFGLCTESIVVHYRQSHDMTFLGWIYLNKAGQWIASFDDGHYQIAGSIEGALELARQSAVSFLLCRLAAYEAR